MDALLTELSRLVEHLLFKSKADYRGQSTVRSFLFGIARKVLLKFLAALSRRRAIDPFQSSLHEIHGRRPSSLLAQQKEHQVLLNVLQEIPITMQETLELYYWEGFSGPELSVAFETSEAAIHEQFFRARKLLSRKLGERGVVRADKELEPMLAEIIVFLLTQAWPGAP